MRAAELAIKEHGRSPTPLRKYTGEPYSVHCAAVAAKVAEVGGSEDMVCAAWLHDVVEDCPRARPDLIEMAFGRQVLMLVMEVSKVSREADGNRAVRVAMDNEHYAHASPQGQTIKLADLLDNARTIVMHDTGFAKVFMSEKRDLLAKLTYGHPLLYAEARRVVDDYFQIEQRRGHS
jgi:(p)ppGpp synthase/HD superfamily hydrolase